MTANPLKNTKTPSLAQRRANVDVIVNGLILVPAIVFILAAVILLAYVVSSTHTTAETLARSSPILIVAVVSIGGTMILAGVLLIWYQIKGEAVVSGKWNTAELNITTKAVGVVLVIVGALLIYFTIQLITVIVFQQKLPPPAVTSIVVPPIDPGKVTPSAPLTIPQEEADFSVPVQPMRDTK